MKSNLKRNGNKFFPIKYEKKIFLNMRKYTQELW